MTRLFFIFAFYFFAILDGSAKVSNKIDHVSVVCAISHSCEHYSEKLASLSNAIIDYDVIKNALKLTLSQTDVDGYSFVISKNNGKSILTIYVNNLPYVKSIQIETSEIFDFLKLKSHLALREGDFYRKDQLKTSIDSIKKILGESGYLNPLITTNVESDSDGVNVFLKIDIGEITKVKKIDVISNEPKSAEILKKRLAYFIDGPWNSYEFNLRLAQINDSYLKEGYILSKVSILDDNVIYKNNEVYLTVEVSLGRKVLFSFFGNTLYSRQELIKSFKEVVSKSVSTLETNLLENAILDLYKKVGLYNVKISSKVLTNKNNMGEDETTFYFNIEEGSKLPVINLTFEGNQHLPTEFLIKYFNKEASVLASRGFFDEVFFADFSNKLKKVYWANGFLFVNINGPNFRYSQDRRKVDITYRISEANKTIVSSIEMAGVNEEMKNSLLQKISNRIGAPFNPEIFSQDQEQIISSLQSLGYYYSKIRNINDDSLLTYEEGFSKAKLFFDIDLKDKIRLDRVLIVGNVKTKNFVIEREIQLKKGELITPLEIEKIKYNLTSLGLFASVKIAPLEDNDQDGLVNLLVSLKERNFGSFEVTPPRNNSKL